jgi:hypothetical protein
VHFVVFNGAFTSFPCAFAFGIIYVVIYNML